jgi:hypothetical protein
MGKRSDFTRRKSDKYLTPYAPILPLLPYLTDVTTFIESCAGDGRLVRHLERHGLRCVGAFDTEPDSLFVRYGDALREPLNVCDAVITNPPWDRKLLHPMIDRFVRDSRQAWLLFDADWCHTRQSVPYMQWCSDIVPVGRVKWIEGTNMAGKDNVAWHRFARDTERTVFHAR